MIDIDLVRKNPQVIRDSLRKRNMDEKVLDDVIEADRAWRELLTGINAMRKERNNYAREIAELSGEERTKTIARTRELSGAIEEKERELNDIEQRRFTLLSYVPNILLPSVPYGRSDEDDVEVKRWGEAKRFDFEPKDHVDIGLALDLFDIERASRVSGARFFYLKNEAVLLEFALVRYAFDILQREGFVPVIPPVLTRESALFGTGFLPFGEENIYRIKGEDLCLVGTAEVPLGAMHAGEILPYKELPKYYAGFSTCFRTEAGAHGKDTKGIFRVHQFDKIEMFKYCLPERSEEEHEALLRTAESIYQGLEIPYRVVNVCSGELGASAAKKYDIEAFLPGQGKYREVVSCSNCLDYQARRQMVRYRTKDGEMRYVHTLNSTAIAIERAIVAILENYQQKDGSVEVPKALRNYMGIEKIE
jgi:seryl-tRNA synthetase